MPGTEATPVEVLVFWFVLRWLLLGRLVLLFGRLLVLMMVVGAIGTLDHHLYVWAACFAGAALLGWLLLGRWRHRGIRSRFRTAAFLAWRGRSASPAILPRVVFWHSPVTAYGCSRTSRLRHPQVGRVLACWDRSTLVSHVEQSRRGERFEFSGHGTVRSFAASCHPVKRPTCSPVTSSLTSCLISTSPRPPTLPVEHEVKLPSPGRRHAGV
jgi:hypothetical protein